MHDSEIKIDGYDLHCLDHNRHGGGVLLYINNNMESYPLKCLDSLENDSIWVKVCLKKVKPIYLCVDYRPPATNVSDLESTERL